jgi:hypothetical protein
MEKRLASEMEPPHLVIASRSAIHRVHPVNPVNFPPFDCMVPD